MDSPLAAKVMSETERQQILSSYQRSARSLIMLDYEGALESAAPATDLRQLMLELCLVRSNEVCIFSRNSSDFLHELFGDLPLNLIAGNGEKIRLKNLEWITDSHANKTHAFQKMISREEYNFILFGGNGGSDEDIFHYLKHQPRAHTIRISDASSYARYHLPNSKALFQLLTDIFHATLPALS